MTNIYMAAYKDYADYDLLKTVCDRITSDMDKNDVTFFVTTGESGDNTCTKYAADNGFRIVDWFPDEQFMPLKEETRQNGHWKEFYNALKTQKSEFISKADHVILVSDYDAKNNGIGYAIRLASKHGKTISVLFPDRGELYVNRFSTPNKTYVYSVSNGTMNFKKIIEHD